MINLAEELKGVQSVAIAGHIRPDGDSIGSCLGLYLYLKENYPDLETDVYLEQTAAAYQSVYGIDEISHDFTRKKVYDLFFCLDCAPGARLGGAEVYQKSAKRTICIDHHISNTGLSGSHYIVPEASSASELVYRVLDKERIPFHAAEALYMGIVHDTGMFRHSCTGPETMEAAADLMRHGIPFTDIIDKTYSEKTYYQNQILGRALLESILLMNGKIIFSAVRLKEMEFYNVGPSDLDGIVQALMLTAGTEAAIFLYETKPQEFKVSMRSKSVIDVSEIAGFFGGGGHVHAAGCTLQGSVYDVVNNITFHMERQLREAERTE